MQSRYNDFNSYLRSIYNCRVQKISIDAGLSCPNRDGLISYGGCIYCNSKGSGTGAYNKGLSIKEQIVSQQKFLKKRYKAKKFLAYFQSFTNTYADIKKLSALYDEALSVEDIVGLCIGTRPDCIDNQILDMIENYAKNYLIWLEYGLQTIHDKTLKFINRGHDRNSFINALESSKNRGIKICVHVIVGLPLETKKHMIETVKFLSNIGIDGIKIHLLYVIKNTKLEELYNNGDYICLKQEEYADIVCDFIERLPKNVVIQRLTGDPHPEELVAPLWSLKKQENLNLIKSFLEKRNTWQGKKLIL